MSPILIRICNVLQFRVLQFRALSLGPSISCPAFSVNPWQSHYSK